MVGPILSQEDKLKLKEAATGQVVAIILFHVYGVSSASYLVAILCACVMFQIGLTGVIYINDQYSDVALQGQDGSCLIRRLVPRYRQRIVAVVTYVLNPAKNNLAS